MGAKFIYLNILLIAGSTFVPFYGIAKSLSVASVREDDYVFDELLFKGKTISAGMIERLNNSSSVEPGMYQLDIYTNGQFSLQTDIPVYLVDNKSKVCFNSSVLTQLGVKHHIIEKLPTAEIYQETLRKKMDCRDINALPNAQVQIYSADQQLAIHLPREYLENRPKDYIPTTELTKGESMAFVNYYLNQYHYSRRQTSSSDSVFATLSSGINVDLWRIRQESTFNYSSAGSKKSSHQWRHIRGYVQRALPNLQSELTIGQNYTSGRLLSGLPYTGFEIATDMRMLPLSVREYAPAIRGIANTNANVIVRQDDSIIHETTVPPGAFEITNIRGTHYKSDFHVTVEEADGTKRTFIVPYITNAELMRPGLSRYSIAGGKLRHHASDTYFTDATYQLGLTNAITANSGLRLSKNYAAILLGGVYANNIGSFGLNLTSSHAKIDDKKKFGWVLDADYDRSFYETNTSLSFGASFYSKQDYLTITDVADSLHDATTLLSDRQYQSKAKFRAMLSQSFEDAGSIYASYSNTLHRNSSKKSHQYQIGYNKTFANSVSLGVSAIRQQNQAPDTNENSTSDTSISVSFSMPLSNSIKAPYFTSSVSHSKGVGTYYQAGINGELGDDYTHYNVNVSRENIKNNAKYAASANIQAQRELGAIGASVSKGKNYWQQSSSLRGAAVIHKGGITLGPYVGDTFALIEAKGAEGAKIGSGGSGARINSAGYALYPALRPYQYNTVHLTADGTNTDVDIVEGSKRIAPFAGMSVKVNFKTVIGYPILIKITNQNPLPMGAAILNEQQQSVGMMGQANQAYIRTDRMKGKLTVSWGDNANEMCEIAYDIRQYDIKAPLIHVESACITPPTRGY